MEIKIVLCDMDGTLLDSQKRIPSNFEEVFNALEKKGIILGIATGRPLSNIRERFPEFYQRMVIIAENGGCIYDRGEILHLEKIPKSSYDRVIDKVRKINDCSLVLCALNNTYIEDTYEYLKKVAKEFYPDLKVVDDLKLIEDDILKMSIRDYIDTKTNTAPHFVNFDVNLDFAPSDRHWLDVMSKGVSKGSGIDVLCEKKHLRKDQIMAFGDHFNDYEMLKGLKHSYAMENAQAEIKKICSHICESNDENGVMNTLIKVFNL